MTEMEVDTAEGKEVWGQSHQLLAILQFF